MMRYMLMICGDENADVELDPVEPWVEEMDGRGVRLHGDRLRPTSEATTVRVRDGEVLLADGPFAESKEHMGGYDLIECRDLDEAIEIAAKHPVAKFGVDRGAAALVRLIRRVVRGVGVPGERRQLVLWHR